MIYRKLFIQDDCEKVAEKKKNNNKKKKNNHKKSNRSFHMEMERPNYACSVSIETLLEILFNNSLDNNYEQFNTNFYL